jgi:hypothetical protein
VAARPSHPAGTLVVVFTLSLDNPAIGAARLRLTGHLDGAAARDVLHAAADVVRCGCTSLVLDLDGLTSWDDDACYAVVGCTQLERWLPEGVDVVAGRGPARELARRAGVVPTAAPDTMAACHAS